LLLLRARAGGPPDHGRAAVTSSVADGLPGPTSREIMGYRLLTMAHGRRQWAMDLHDGASPQKMGHLPQRWPMDLYDGSSLRTMSHVPGTLGHGSSTRPMDPCDGPSRETMARGFL